MGGGKLCPLRALLVVGQGGGGVVLLAGQEGKGGGALQLWLADWSGGNSGSATVLLLYPCTLLSGRSNAVVTAILHTVGWNTHSPGYH
jgi:hypothetical protein